MKARRLEWCSSCRRRTWHTYRVNGNHNRRWLEEVSRQCERCLRCVWWRSFGVGNLQEGVKP